MADKKGLGRGFDSLIPDDLFDEGFNPVAGQDAKLSQLREINHSDIRPDEHQPRKFFDEDGLKELAESIRLHGIVQPLVVTQHGNTYTIVAGERRWRAASMAGLKVVPALVRSLDSQARLEIALIENIQRRDLTAIETAVGYAKLRDEFNLTLEEIGKRVGGRSISSVSNTLRLLKLHPDAKSAIAEGVLSEGQARPLIGADEKVIEELLPRIIKEEWSARKVEQAVRNAGHTKVQTSVSRVDRSRADSLAKAIGLPVQVKSRGQSGTVTIRYKTEEQLQQLEKLLGD